MTNTVKFLKIYSATIEFCMKKNLCSTEYKQEVSDFWLPYNGSAL